MVDEEFGGLEGMDRNACGGVWARIVCNERVLRYTWPRRE